MIFGKKLLSSFSMSQIYFFDLGLDRLDATHFIDCSWPIFGSRTTADPKAGIG